MPGLLWTPHASSGLVFTFLLIKKIRSRKVEHLSNAELLPPYLPPSLSAFLPGPVKYIEDTGPK